MSESKNEPAFPVLETSLGNNVHIVSEHRGMTLRDYFAAAAFPALIQAMCHNGCASPKNCSKKAYDYADAMLEARKEGE